MANDYKYTWNTALDTLRQNTWRFNINYDKGWNLHESLYREAVYKYGREVLYIRETDFQPDNFFGEWRSKSYSAAYTLVIRMEDQEVFAGQDSWTPFGLENQDEANFHCPIAFFTQLGFQPQIGDLIYTFTHNKLFEITFVEDEIPFYPLGKNMAYYFKCKEYTYDHSKINTGNTAVDTLKTIDERIKETTNDEIEEILGIDGVLDDTEKNPLYDS